MPLSDDQRALLRLLAQREEGYEDIAALMGLSVGEVRSRVKGALAELERGGEVAAPQRSSDREPSETATIAEPPTSPEPPRQQRQRVATPASPSAPRPQKRRRQFALPKRRRRLAELAGGALLVILLVLFATGAVDIGDGDSDGASAENDGAAATNVASGSGKLTQAVLAPVGDGEGRGRALFGRLRKEVVLQVVAEGLEPTAAGESYTAWLYRSPKLALRVGAVKVGDSGQLAARFAIPAEVLALVANGAFKQIRLSRTSDGAYEAEVAEAKEQQRLPRYNGETVLSGEITGPLAEIGAAGG